MKKSTLLLVMIVCLMGLAGCNGKPQESGKNVESSKQGEGSKEDNLLKSNFKIASEDFKPGNTSIVKTDKGYYYYSAEKAGLCYADAVTGKEMYLCNKPECRHDGNEFCVATTDRYWIKKFCLYGGTLFATAVEETDTQYLYKLLTIALDGSEMNEVTTYYTLEKGQQKASPYSDGRQLLMHRNKVIFPMEIMGQENLADATYYGLGILDLNTMEMTFVDEEAISKENPESRNISVHGDYVYFCRTEGKKTVLYRYHMTEGTKESYKLLVGFSGTYLVLDDDTVIYTKRSGNVLCVHHHATGENEEKVRLTKIVKMHLSDGSVVENTQDYKVGNLVTDGVNIYVAEQGKITYVSTNPETGETEEISEMKLHVFNRDLEETETVELSDIISPMEWEGVEGGLYSQPRMFSYVGDEVYTTFSPEDNMADVYTFRCKLEDLLDGKPEFELVYSDLYSARE